MLRRFDVLRYQVHAELKAEMDRAYFGLIWWVAEPILYMVVFYIVFSLLFKRGSGDDFVPFLLCGLVAWRWFDASLRTGATSILLNGPLMNQVYLPKLIFPMVTVMANSLKFFVILGILLVFLLLYGIEPTISWLALPILIAVQFLIVTAGATLLALLVPFFPDLNILISNALTLLLFLSGVFFSIRDMPQKAQDLFYLNPMAVIIEAYRDILIHGKWPDWLHLGTATLTCLLVGILVWRLAKRFDKIYPKLVM